MATKNNTTQNALLHDYLRGTGRTLTARQAKSKFRIGNLRARISELRQAGLVVVTEKTREGFNKYSINQRDIWGKKTSYTK